jgi:hypothetical protein
LIAAKQDGIEADGLRRCLHRIEGREEGKSGRSQEKFTGVHVQSPYFQSYAPELRGPATEYSFAALNSAVAPT